MCIYVSGLIVKPCFPSIVESWVFRYIFRVGAHRARPPWNRVKGGIQWQQRHPLSGTVFPRRRSSFTRKMAICVSTRIKRDQFHQFRGSHSDGKLGFGHTYAPAGVDVKVSHTSKPATSSLASTPATTLRRTQEEKQC